MSKIEINYDLMHTIKEAKEIKKCPKEFSIITKPFVFMYPGAVLFNSIKDQIPAQYAITATTIATLLSLGAEQLLLSLMMKKTTMELAKVKLEYLVERLKNINIQTDVELLLDSKVYRREYKLKKDSPIGVIRERFINVPSYNYKGNITTVSVKEEHMLATKDYILSLGEPEAKDTKVFRKAYGAI